ncbi:MAG: hypothetical protein ACPGVT_00065 [Maricaulaceae bacterium]
MFKAIAARFKPPVYETFITARLNMKLMPMDRGELFEDTLSTVLNAKRLGETTGGGTLLGDDNLRTNEGDHEGVSYSEVEISAINAEPRTTKKIIECLEDIGAAKGSRLILPDDMADIEFGQLEGLGLYLNGTDLPDETYANSDINQTITTLEILMGDHLEKRLHWQGSQDTALYFYGRSFTEMNAAIAGYLPNDRLCDRCRIVQIA